MQTQTLKEKLTTELLILEDNKGPALLCSTPLKMNNHTANYLGNLNEQQFLT